MTSYFVEKMCCNSFHARCTYLWAQIDYSFIYWTFSSNEDSSRISIVIQRICGVFVMDMLNDS